jgi:serine/threonine protein kinase/sugar lactone lactonase YvrE
MALALGTKLGPYEVVVPLGAGGMGEVYRAHDPKLKRDVAIKVLPSLVSNDAERLRRFEQEACSAAALNHPNILVVYQLGMHDGAPYLVSELLEGCTLREQLKRGPLPLRKVIDCGVQVARGLAAAHEKGIVHRDLKPENLFVMKDGRLKILDFGLAKLMQHQGTVDVNAPTLTDWTEAGAVLGTVGYMSPEQVSGKPTDHRVDIFAFGAILYETLTGKRAFRKPTSAETMSAILNEDPPAVAQLVAATPPALQRVVQRCLEKNPEQRFQSASDLAFALEALSDSTSLSAAAPTTLHTKKARWKWTALGALILALLAGGGLVLFRSPESTGPLRLEYTQLTNFTDSAVAPALSPDGRMLVFIRGNDTFIGPGEIYVKLLPDGEPVRLTHDGQPKMGPLAFSPDGSRIAYSISADDTWTVPVLGGEPSHWLANVGGLSWISVPGEQRRILFSVLTTQGIHMGVYTSTESRADERKVYLPSDVNGMAHRSYLSPDGRSILTAEMDLSGWLPCRRVPFDGSSPGQRVGPQPSQCTDAAWSPDGKWMYFSADTGEGFHIWRQPYSDHPDGLPERVTSGATEEQGISFAADGRSFVTSVGEKQSTIWVHTPAGDRQITSQGYAFLPAFSGDGNRLYYLQRSRANRRFVSGELWVVNLVSGTHERLLPDFLLEHYHVAADGKRIVFIAPDDAGHSRLWIAALDGSSRARRLSTLDCVRALFGAQNDVYFVGGETTAIPFLYHVNTDGSGLQKVVPNRILFLYDVSPDGKWLAVWEENESAIALYSSEGTTRRLLCAGCGTAGAEDRGITPPMVSWSRDGKRFYFHETPYSTNKTISGAPIGEGNMAKSAKTYVVPLEHGRIVPELPASGFPSTSSAATALGGHLLREERVFPSADPSVYAFPRPAAHRNIFRIRVP